MKKKLLIAFLVTITVMSSASDFVFNKTPNPTVAASPYTAGCIYVNGSDTVINATTNSVTDVFVPILCTILNPTAGQELSLSSKETDANIASGKKALVFKGGSRAIILDGTKRKLKISGLTIGESILFSIGSKGSTAHTFTPTGATADVNNPVLGVKGDNYVFVNWKYTATATEAIFYVETGGCIINSIKTGSDAITGVNQVFSENSIFYNGSQIINENNLPFEVYNVLGKLIAKSNTTINTNNFEKGIYMVRAQGVQDAFKFSK